MAKMQGPSFNQIMMLGGLGIAAIAAYEVYVNLPNIQAAIQSALNPVNMYQQQGYYCPSGGVPSPTGLCPNGQPAINSSQFNQLASMAGGCSDGSIVNPSTGRCANGSLPMSTGGYGSYNPLTGQYQTGYPQTSVCNDGSQPNPYNGLCANGSVPTSVGTGVNNALMSPYGAPSSVYPTIAGGVGVPGGTTFTDPTTGQVYDPTTGALLTPGGSYTTPSLASPYSSIFPTLSPLAGNGIFCGDGSNPSATGMCSNGQQAIGWPQSSPPTPAPTSTTPVATTITTANPSGTMGCADGSTASSTTGLCANGQAPSVSLPAGTTTSPTGAVPVTATPTGTGTTTVTPTPAPAPVPTTVTPQTSTQPVTQTSPAPVTTTTTSQPVGAQPGAPGGSGGQPSLGGSFNRFSGQQQSSNMNNRWGGRFGYVGYQSEGAMIAAQAFAYTPRDRTRASVTSYSSVRPKIGNSPITTEVFGRRYFPQQPIYVSNSR